MRIGSTTPMGATLVGAAAAVVAIVGLVLAGDGSPNKGQTAEAQEVAERPNFVFVMTDDLDERSVQDLGGIRSVMGSNGATFENAFVNYSLCCPSRATFLRGQYPHNHGITGHTDAEGAPRFRQLGRDQSTIATWLDGAGYRTKYLGKYLNGYWGPYIPPGWDEWFGMHGTPENNQVNDDGQIISLTGNSTDAYAAEASDFIRRASAEPDPFFVMVGTRAPHQPPEVPERYQNSFATTPLPRPPNFDEEDVSDKPQWVRAYPRVTQAHIDRAQTLYRNRLRSMLAVEDLLRQLVATLQETGELDNTYVFFTSDNGYHIGSHRLVPGDKKTPYEEDIGVPLMVRGPGVPAGAVRQQMVLNNDTAPTIADLAGVPTPAFVDGRSFAPLLTDAPPSSWRQAFLEEGWLASGTLVPTNKAVRTQTHSFVEYDTGERELYDLVADPHQLQSMPRAGNEALYSSMETRLYNLRGCSGANCRTAEWTTDATAPAVSGVTPADGATNVAFGANTEANFSEALDANTINNATFALSGPDGTPVASTVSYSASTNKATLDPTEDLRAGTTYTAKIKGGADGAKDLAGNPLAADRVWSFTTTTTAACTIAGTSAADTLTGTPGDDVICGGAGSDTIKGSEGNDVLRGEAGNDRLYGGAGNDTLDGGIGTTDTADFSASLTAVVASLVGSTATGEGSDALAGIEGLLGSPKNDTLTGSAGVDSLNGNGGDDTVWGGDGPDKLIGSGGNDALHGEPGNDSVTGSPGADFLFGEDGDDAVDSKDGVSANDSLDGGAGTDTKVTDATERSIVGFP